MQIDDGVLNELKDKHPPAAKADIGSMIQGPFDKPEEVIYDSIDGAAIYNAAKKNTWGSWSLRYRF